MKIPKYVKDMLWRSEYLYLSSGDNENYVVGYSIKIYKYSYHSMVGTLANDIEKLKKFVERNNGEMIVLSIPEVTRWKDQYAVVTIFDPLMKELEKYIGKDGIGHIDK